MSATPTIAPSNLQCTHSLSITVCFSHVELALSPCTLPHSLACSHGHSHHSLFRLYTHIVESCTLQSQQTLPRRASVSMGRFSRAVRSRSSPPSVETQRSATGACMCTCVVAAHDDVELQCWRQLQLHRRCLVLPSLSLLLMSLMMSSDGCGSGCACGMAGCSCRHCIRGDIRSKLIAIVHAFHFTFCVEFPIDAPTMSLLV